MPLRHVSHLPAAGAQQGYERHHNVHIVVCRRTVYRRVYSNWACVNWFISFCRIQVDAWISSCLLCIPLIMNLDAIVSWYIWRPGNLGIWSIQASCMCIPTNAWLHHARFMHENPIQSIDLQLQGQCTSCLLRCQQTDCARILRGDMAITWILARCHVLTCLSTCLLVRALISSVDLPVRTKNSARVLNCNTEHAYIYVFKYPGVDFKIQLEMLSIHSWHFYFGGCHDKGLCQHAKSWNLEFCSNLFRNLRSLAQHSWSDSWW